MSASILAISAPLPSQADNPAGSYLVTRQAELDRDYSSVIEYGPRALSDNPDDGALLESLVVAHTSLGEVNNALPFAHRLSSVDENNQLAGLILLSDALANENWGEASTLMEGGASYGGMVDQMVLAWVSLGQGQMSEAIDVFDELSQDESTKPFAQFQKALALANAGDFEGAANIFGNEEQPLQLKPAWHSVLRPSSKPA